MPFVEDLVPFFSTVGFASAVELDNGSTINAIFDNAYIDAGGLGVTGMQPILTCRASDVASVAAGDGCTVAGIGYTVVGIQPDGTGVTVLHLAVAVVPAPSTADYLVTGSDYAVTGSDYFKG